MPPGNAAAAIKGTQRGMAKAKSGAARANKVRSLDKGVDDFINVFKLAKGNSTERLDKALDGFCKSDTGRQMKLRPPDDETRAQLHKLCDLNSDGDVRRSGTICIRVWRR